MFYDGSMATDTAQTQASLDRYDVVDWRALRDVGFQHVPGFLSVSEREVLRRDFERAGSVQDEQNANYDVQGVSVDVLWRFEPKLECIGRAVAEQVGIVTDVTSGSLYFAAQRLSFPWHQDHESYFLFQDHQNYLNFYIPFIKPERQKSNVCVIAFDRLLERAPEAKRLVGGGATLLEAGARMTRVTDNEHGRQFCLPISIESLAETPQLEAGDLLLMRGDVIHRTQDSDTPRVAVSFRRQNGAHVVDAARLTRPAEAKRRVMSNNARPYDSAKRALEAANGRLTVRELLELMDPGR